MHTVTVTEDLALGLLGTFPPGVYLLEDRNASEIMFGNPNIHPRLNYFEHKQRLRHDLPATAKILLLGTIGLGDGIMLTPVLRKIKELYPAGTLHIACFAEHRQIFSGLPYVDGFDDYPMALDQEKSYDQVLYLEGAVEFNDRAKEQHMTDRYADHLGLPEITEKFPDYIVQPEEREWIFATFPKTEGKKRVGIQVQAGVRCRTTPAKLLTTVVQDMVKRGWEVVLMGRPGEFVVNKELPGIVNLTSHNLTFRQSAAYLLTCDAFFGPDSSLLHVAGALKVPAVGIFAAYPWQIRTANYPTVRVIQGHEGCEIAPCFHQTVQSPMTFPANGPCAKTGFCVALGHIDPARIVGAIEKSAAASQSATSPEAVASA